MKDKGAAEKQIYLFQDGFVFDKNHLKTPVSFSFLKQIFNKISTKRNAIMC